MRDKLDLSQTIDWRARYLWLREKFRAYEEDTFNWPEPSVYIMSGASFDDAVDDEIAMKETRKAERAGRPASNQTKRD